MQKPIEEILEMLDGKEKLVLYRCGGCAAVFHTGGEAEVKQMTDTLSSHDLLCPEVEKFLRELGDWFNQNYGCREKIMHPLAKRHLDKVLRKAELLGIDKRCKYYPCHHGDLEDCTFCFCPFYPCGDESTGGKWIKGTTWSCKDCSWIHRTEVAGRVLKEIKRLGINKSEDIDKSWVSLNKVREVVKALYSPWSAAYVRKSSKKSKGR